MSQKKELWIIHCPRKDSIIQFIIEITGKGYDYVEGIMNNKSFYVGCGHLKDVRKYADHLNYLGCTTEIKDLNGEQLIELRENINPLLCSKKGTFKSKKVRAKSSELIKPHNFNRAKSSIQQFASTVPDEITLQEFEVDCWHGLWDHKVTGQEMNNYSLQVQNQFIRTNETLRSVFYEFSDVYDAFEALDKDYIQGILIAIREAEEASEQALQASEQALNASDENKRTIEALKKTIEKIKEIKKDVSSMQSSSQKQIVNSNTLLYVIVSAALFISILQFILNLLGIL